MGSGPKGNIAARSFPMLSSAEAGQNRLFCDEKYLESKLRRDSGFIVGSAPASAEARDANAARRRPPARISVLVWGPCEMSAARVFGHWRTTMVTGGLVWPAAETVTGTARPSMTPGGTIAFTW
jgi:hypothetical protein